MWKAGLVVLVLLGTAHAAFDGCTAIAVGKKASADGSTFTTHTNDCTNCDTRIAFVPGGRFPAGSKKPIYPGKTDYPRFVGVDRGDTYYPEGVDLQVLNASTAPVTAPIGFLEQVPETYSYIDGNYGIANEHQLMMGESTCAANLVAYGAPLGDALFDVAALSRLALERCKTARCAITLMGETAERWGFYGNMDPLSSPQTFYMESGEALTIIDTEEAWVFHILPDDTGKSAVWAAQRVPDDHIAVVANMFIIGEVDLADTKNFLGSANMMDVARRTGLWDPVKDGAFNFRKAYSPHARNFERPNVWYRRTWSIFHRAAPSLNLEPDRTEPYPFSIKPDRLITLEDMFNYNRDYFQGTKYDLSQGPAAGPYGNPVRYDASGQPYTVTGFFERAVSLHRTSYSFVVQARAFQPHSGAVVWFGQHAPHTTAYVPFYSAVNDMPVSYKKGTIYKLTREGSWWAFASVQNYAEKMYSVMMTRAIGPTQRLIEDEGRALVLATDERINALVSSTLPSSSDSSSNWMDPERRELRNKIRALVTDASVTFGQRVTQRWWDLLDHLFTTVRDGFTLDSPHPPAKLRPVFYPAWWLARAGFYDNGPRPAWIDPPKFTPSPPHPEKMDVFRTIIPAEAATTTELENLFQHNQMTMQTSQTAQTQTVIPTTTAAAAAPSAVSSTPSVSLLLAAGLMFSVVGYALGRWHQRKVTDAQFNSLGRASADI